MLGPADLPAVLRLLALPPGRERVRGFPDPRGRVEASSLGCPVWGYERDGELRSLCHAGANLVPVNADPDAVAAWTEFAGPERMCFSIIGPSAVALDLWRRLSSAGAPAWSKVRDVRPRQPVMAISGPPQVEPIRVCAGWGWSTGTATTRPR